MKLPILYKYSTTGALQQWEIEVESNKYRTHSGQVNGAITTTEWTSCLGKNGGKSNATTDEEQALKEAQAKWEKQVKLNQYRDTIEQLKTSKRYIEPMLAQNFKDRKNKINFSDTVYIQVKLNGVRCIATKDGLFSRKGKEYVSAPHISKGLEKFFEANPDAVLDGERFNNDLRQNLNKLISLVKKTKPTEEDLLESENIVEYHIYDTIISGDYTHRYQYIKDYIFGEFLEDDNRYKFVESIVATSLEDVENTLRLFESDGHEGVMVRLDGPYENKRSQYLLKHKSFVDAEFKIVEVVEGKGNLSGKCGTIKFIDESGKTFEASPLGTHEFFEELWVNREKLIGLFATVKYKELTPLKSDGTGGVPSFGKVLAIRNYE